MPNINENELVVLIAKAICPYGWRDDFWREKGREHHCDRNQKHVQENAFAQARDVLSVLRRIDVLKPL